MDWWQILLIIVGSIISGLLVGILISYLISLLMKKPLSKTATAAAEQPGAVFGRLARRFTRSSTPEPQSAPAILTEPAGPTVTAQPTPVQVNPPEEMVAEESVVPSGQTIDVATELLDEVEQNRRLAATPSKDKLVPFQTKVWDLYRDGLQTLPVNLREDLTQAYVDIRLANSIVWLSAELGRRSPNLDESYSKLCRNIATRLDRVRPQLK